ncbi:hypothetical protein STEG23_023327, partial [Scotinomys teguina]
FRERDVNHDIMLRVETLLVGTILVGTNLVDTILVGTMLVKTMLVGTMLVEIMLVEIMLVGTILVGTMLVKTMLVGTMLVEIMLVGTMLVEIMLSPYPPPLSSHPSHSSSPPPASPLSPFVCFSIPPIFVPFCQDLLQSLPSGIMSICHEQDIGSHMLLDELAILKCLPVEELTISVTMAEPRAQCSSGLKEMVAQRLAFHRDGEEHSGANYGCQQAATGGSGICKTD